MNLIKEVSFNIFGLIIVVVLLTPNLLYLFLKQDKKKQDKKKHENVNDLWNILEQIGRYGSIIFMIVTTNIASVSETMIMINVIVTAILTVFYVWMWRAYFINENNTLRLLLAILPGLIFIASGILLKHPFLILTSVLFLVAHVKITLDQ